MSLTQIWAKKTVFVQALDKRAIEFNAINEEEAIILAELVAQDLSKQSFGISTQAGTEALRALI